MRYLVTMQPAEKTLTRQMYTWMSSSFPRPPAKRAVALAFMVSHPHAKVLKGWLTTVERALANWKHCRQCEYLRCVICGFRGQC